MKKGSFATKAVSSVLAVGLSVTLCPALAFASTQPQAGSSVVAAAAAATPDWVADLDGGQSTQGWGTVQAQRGLTEFGNNFDGTWDAEHRQDNMDDWMYVWGIIHYYLLDDKGILKVMPNNSEPPECAMVTNPDWNPTTLTGSALVPSYGPYRVSEPIDPAQVKRLVVCEGFTSLGDVSQLTAVERIDIASSVQNIVNIGNWTSSRSNITEVNFAPGSQLKELPNCAFNKTGIKTLDLSDTQVRSIANTASGQHGYFAESPLEELKLPKGLAQISSDAFWKADSLSDLYVYGNDIAWIEGDADPFWYTPSNSISQAELAKYKEVLGNLTVHVVDVKPADFEVEKTSIAVANGDDVEIKEVPTLYGYLKDLGASFVYEDSPSQAPDQPTTPTTPDKPATPATPGTSTGGVLVKERPCPSLPPPWPRPR